jgi:diguanylate cyclase (GGDEF)-like protein
LLQVRAVVASVLWVGRRHGAHARLLRASGFDVIEAPGLDEAMPLVERTAPHVVVLGGEARRGRHGLGELVGRAAGERAARVVALVPGKAGVGAALAAGAHDAVSEADGPEELRMRLTTWAKNAAEERQQARSLSAIAEHLGELKVRLGELERENLEMRELAHRDELTGLGNRRSFRAKLDYALEYAGRYGGVVSVVLCDLDGMKRLNDLLGHPAGDAALRAVGKLFRASLRGTDHAARLGGDEFGVVMPATPGPAAEHVAERIRQRIAALPLPDGAALAASLGVATASEPRAFAADDLITRADAALYAAKRAGKNRVSGDGSHISTLASAQC